MNSAALVELVEHVQDLESAMQDANPGWRGPARWIDPAEVTPAPVAAPSLLDQVRSHGERAVVDSQLAALGEPVAAPFLTCADCGFTRDQELTVAVRGDGEPRCNDCQSKATGRVAAPCAWPNDDTTFDELKTAYLDLVAAPYAVRVGPPLEFNGTIELEDGVHVDGSDWTVPPKPAPCAGCAELSKEVIRHCKTIDARDQAIAAAVEALEDDDGTRRIDRALSALRAARSKP